MNTSIRLAVVTAIIGVILIAASALMFFEAVPKNIGPLL